MHLTTCFWWSVRDSEASFLIWLASHNFRIRQLWAAEYCFIRNICGNCLIKEIHCYFPYKTISTSWLKLKLHHCIIWDRWIHDKNSYFWFWMKFQKKNGWQKLLVCWNISSRTGFALIEDYILKSSRMCLIIRALPPCAYFQVLTPLESELYFSWKGKWSQYRHAMALIALAIFYIHCIPRRNFPHEQIFLQFS